MKNVRSQSHGLVYSIDGSAPTLLRPTSFSSSATLNFFFSNFGDKTLSFMSYGDDDMPEWSPENMPSSLDSNCAYIFGLDADYLKIASDLQRYTVSDDIAKEEVTLTFYPASVLSNDIDVDIFDLIIDPATYTTAELQHFASHGIEPAIKNTDGSYTIKSQLTQPLPELPELTIPL